MADTTIQKQGEVFISQSEYDALRLAGNLQSNTKYHITKTPKTGVDSLEQMNLLNGDKTVTYNTTDGMAINGQARFTYNGGTTKDVTMDVEVPLVAGEGITIDKKADAEQVEIKANTDDLSGFFMPRVGSGEIPAVNYSGTVVGKYYGPFSGGIPTYSDDDVGEDTGGNFLYAMTTGSENLADANKSKFRLTNKQYVDDGFVAKQTTTVVGPSFVYAYDSKGDRQFQITGSSLANTVPIRYNGGRIRVGTAVEDSDAMPKKQVEDGFVAKLIPTATRSVVAINTDGSQELITIHGGSAVQGSIPLRSTGGVVRVGTPVAVNDATTKAYVDGLHHYSHHVKLDLIPSAAGGTSAASICMTVASKNAPNAVASLNDIEVTTSLAHLLYYLADEVEGWEFSSTGYIKHNGTMYMVYDLYVDIDYKVEASCINLSTMAQANLVLTDINETWQVVDFVV